MPKKPTQRRLPPPTPTPLREHAERRWLEMHAGQPSKWPDDLQANIYELEVHQIELELQNEELRRAQLEITEARNRYLDLYDFAPVGYLTLNAHRVIREANLTAASLLGMERSRLLGMRVEKLVAKAARDALYLHLCACQESKSSQTCYIPFCRADGSEFHARLESVASDFPRADGGQYRLVFTDVTALRIAEEAVAQSERRFRALTENGSEYVTIVDAAGTVVYENPAAIRGLGFDSGDLVGRNALTLAHPQDLPALRQTFDNLTCGHGQTAVIELRARARDGTWRWLHVVATNLLEDPTVRGIVLNSHDITERRKATEELQRLNEALDERVRNRTAAIELLYDIASVANRARDVRQAVEYCLRRLTEFNGWQFGHALMPSSDDGILRLACSWYPEGSERFARFRKATEKVRFGEGDGLVGQVLAERTRVWTTQLSVELTGARARAAARLALGTGVAFPVLVGEKVAAVLEFFSDQILDLDERTAEIVTSVGLQLGRVFERATFHESLLRIADQTQQRIAQDLHDDVGQELTGLGLKAETLAEVLAAIGPDCGEQAEETGACLCRFPDVDGGRCGRLAADVMATASRVQHKVRDLAHRILPIEIELNSLPGALAHLAQEGVGGSHAVCTFHNSHPETIFEGRIATQLYRIAQEAVSNAIRHGQAPNVRIELAEEDGQTVLRIADDGRGMPKGAGDGMGMRIMRYRARLLGGTLEVGPGGQGGTLVICRLPATKTYQLVRKRKRKQCPPES